MDILAGYGGLRSIDDMLNAFLFLSACKIPIISPLVTNPAVSVVGSKKEA